MPMIGTLNQNPILYAALLASVAPLLAFLLIMVVTRRHERVSAGLSIAAIAMACICSILLLVRYWGLTEPLQVTGTWVTTGQLVVSIGFVLDPLSLLMVTVVSSISLLVQVYSIGYMAGDPGFSRYYAYMSLFAWAMISLVLSPNLLQLYVFWELVGVSSYLLIGFWYEKFSASEAGKKAFVMTRFGDVAFLLGLVLLWLHMGSLDIVDLNDPAKVTQRVSPTMITLTGLLIFGGIVGKSAQFPLLTWLPDAMEGPTPVSALLHSATMVAAGVYLFARLFGFFALSPTMMTVCLAIGTISLLLASTMAMVARDIKQVWAYSTISQLGFMLMGLGAGSFFAGVFHLITHAGFKALLFLSAGVLIHHFHTNDMITIGRAGGRRLKSTTVCMIVAAAALSGLPPLSGFFSKELILGRLLGLDNPIWFLAGALGAFLTAYYTFRLVFIIVRPEFDETPDRADNHNTTHGTAGLLAMQVVLWILAAGTVILGFFQGPILAFLKTALGTAQSQTIGHFGWLPIAACTLAIVAIGLAWVEFGRKGAPRYGFVERIPSLARFFGERWYLDRFYRFVLDTFIYKGVSRLFTWNDRKIIDGVVDGSGGIVVHIGGLIARLHTTMIQYRLMIMAMAIALLVLYVAMSG